LVNTGITDSDHGHISPATKEVADNKIPLNDEKLKLRYFTKKRLRTAARDYFVAKIKLKELPNGTKLEMMESETDFRLS
jgi:hypothetical protein